MGGEQDKRRERARERERSNNRGELTLRHSRSYQLVEVMELFHCYSMEGGYDLIL